MNYNFGMASIFYGVIVTCVLDYRNKLEVSIKRIQTDLSSIENDLNTLKPTDSPNSNLTGILANLTILKNNLDNIAIFIKEHLNGLNLHFPKELQTVENALNHAKSNCCEYLAEYERQLQRSNVEIAKKIYDACVSMLDCRDKIELSIKNITTGLASIEGDLIALKPNNPLILLNVTEKINKLTIRKTDLDKINIFIGEHFNYLNFFFPKELQSIEKTLNDAKINCCQYLIEYSENQRRFESSDRIYKAFWSKKF